MRVIRPGEGPLLCTGTSASGLPCTNNEVDGLEYCLHHVPDELLDEAEGLTGMMRCRHGFGEPGACHYIAVKGTQPPRCKNHGARVGQPHSKQAAVNVIQGQVATRVAAIMAEHGERLLNAAPVLNPLTELRKLAGEMLAFKDILAERVAGLQANEWRYAGSRTGEQVRAELILYERAMDRLQTCLVNIAKLKIEETLARIEDRQVTMVEHALTVALQASGATLEGQDAARKVLVRELGRAG
jgi:hypothetical protein